MRTFKQEESGSVLVMTGFSMLLILLLLGLVIDGGNMYVTKSHLQKTANAAALSGAQEIPASETAVKNVVEEIIGSHNETGSLLAADVSGNELQVRLGRSVPLFFGSLFGQEAMTLEVEAKAGIDPIASGIGAVPLGINESIPLVYGQEYELKVDSGDSEAGNFGVLALAGPGAQNYENSLMHGFQQELKIGDIVPTQTGNIAGATRKGINHRIDTCPYPDGDYQQRDCPRVMLVIVYKPHEKSTNQLKSIRITGFAYFYVSERMGSNDDSIRGTFIRRTGPGTAGEQPAPDKGAYTVRLKR
ncbi:pilus assembly protein TadG-related protein [Bacillus daqingensis]|uniref:Pilus assembly protein TadG-related protein n=1 Tax=Bacillus daqingensis TaxID=872396 RepID=A0ABV9NVC2_9BACI